jgi:hypothetical protein
MSPHDFDFFHGDWEVRNRRLTDFLDPGSDWKEFPATNRCWPLFDGAANIDEIDMPYLGSKGAPTGSRRARWTAARAGGPIGRWTSVGRRLPEGS